MEKLKTDLPDIGIDTKLKDSKPKVERIVLPKDFNIHSNGHYNGKVFIYNEPLGPLSYNQLYQFHSFLTLCVKEIEPRLYYLYAFSENTDEEVKKYVDDNNLKVLLVLSPIVGHIYTKEQLGYE